MKQILIKRFLVAITLFFIGILSILCAAGDDELPMFAFFVVHIGFLIVGMTSFYVLGRLLRRWDKETE